MTVETAKGGLIRSLQEGRDAMLWKLEGASDYDVRRPLTPTGTNLLGLVKHLAYVELGYFVQTFGRPMPVATPWDGEVDVDPHADLVATADESRDDVIALYRLAWDHAGRTFRALELGDTGRVPHWPEDRNEVTLHQMLVRVVAETHRHAGQPTSCARRSTEPPAIAPTRRTCPRTTTGKPTSRGSRRSPSGSADLPPAHSASTASIARTLRSTNSGRVSR